MVKRIVLLCCIAAQLTPLLFAQAQQPLKIAIIGLTHTHVHWLLGRPERGDVEIVAIVEPNKDLARRYTSQHDIPYNLVYSSTAEMLKKVKPEAVTAFGSIYEHLEVVETFAPLGIHVMVEKPLAVNTEHALKMKSLAEKHDIQLLTNYETTWYPTNHEAYRMLKNDQIGPMRKVVVHDGHKGPIELGINQEFLDWLLDPVQNGGGAITDFGCYGLNLLTWLNDGAKPLEVQAMTQTIKPEIYPEVDDEATILVKYPKMQGVVQASWNWPVARKDMEVYGKRGFVICEDRNNLKFQLSDTSEVVRRQLPERVIPLDDPFGLFAAVIKGHVQLKPYDPSSLENNMIVVELLDAAKESARTGKVVKLK